METLKIIYKVKTATLTEIFAHLMACDDDFHPPLNERVNIKEYSQKIFEKSITFEAWRGVTLVGLLAAYFNDIPSRSTFITNVSVLKNFMSLGIASELLRKCIGHAVQENIREIRLEVNKRDSQALGLYRKFDFVVDGLDNDFLKMKIEMVPYFDK